MERLIQLLNSIYRLSPEMEAYLGKTIKTKQLPKKGYLLKEGHVCHNIYFIQQGLLRCYYLKNDEQVSSWFMQEGDVIVSVESFFDQVPSTEFIQALEDCTLYYIEYNELQYMYKHFMEFNFIGRVLTEKYYKLSEQRVNSMRMQRGEERYEYLEKHYPSLIQRVQGKHLASYLGITEVHLSNIRARRKIS